MRIGLLSYADIDNYGDKLFGMIARAELARRLPMATITLLSPTGQCDDGIEYQVWRPDVVTAFDALILVGGEVIGADDDMLRGMYRRRGLVTAAERPTDLVFSWAEHDVPYKAWFAVGAPAGVSETIDQRIRQALPHLHHLSVRGLLSKQRVDRWLAPPRLTDLVPDLGWLLPAQVEAEPERWRGRPGLVPDDQPYLVFQTFDLCLDGPERVERIAQDLLHIEATTGLRVVLVPITRCWDDATTLAAIHRASGQRLRLLPDDLTVFEITAVLRGARAGISSSLHGTLTCLSFGVPAAVIYPRPETKFSEVLGAQFRPAFLCQDWSELRALATLLADESPAPLERSAAAMLAQLARAWDRVASEITAAMHHPRPQPYRLADAIADEPDTAVIRHLRHLLQERIADLDRVQDQLAQISSERAAALAALQQRDADVVEKQDHIDALDQQLVDLASDRENALAALGQRDAHLDEKQQHIDLLQGHLAEMTAARASALAILGQRDADLTAQKAQIAAQQAQIAALQSQTVSAASSATLVGVVTRRYVPPPLIPPLAVLYRHTARPAGRVVRRLMRRPATAVLSNIASPLASPTPTTAPVDAVAAAATAEPSPVSLVVDNLSDGATFIDVLEIGGWAFSTAGAIVRIEVLLDGQAVGSVPYGNSRPDVQRHHRHVTTDDCGFHAILPAPVGQLGRHALTVRAADTRGNAATVTGTLFRVELQEPAGAIEQAVRRSTTVHVAGWALWPVQHPPARARLRIGEVLLGETRVHRTRPDIWLRYRTTSAAFRSGFRFEVVLPPSLVIAATDTVTVECIDGEAVAMTLTAPIERQAAQDLSFDLAAWSALIDEYQRRYGRSPALLDHATDLDLATALPQVVVFAPPNDAATLPYLERSIDLVAVGSDAPEHLAEARRVASDGVIVTTEGQPQIDWLSEPSATSASPSVSIIVATYNTADITLACLRQTLATLPAAVPVELIVIDDASTDDSYERLTALATEEPRLQVLRNPENRRFLRSCNRAVATATGDVVVFLNSDTLPQPHWLEPLLEVLTTAPEAGAVGGKLIYPDGRLQEAGGAIFADGSGWNLGRGSPTPDAPLFNVVREVDYCSGALLATWRHLFEAYGGFDDRFAPMYYEDTDYCFGVRALGYRVYYQPRCVVIHLEGASAGTDIRTGAKAAQATNRAVFAAKWARDLAERPPVPAWVDEDTVYAVAMRGVPRGTGVSA